LIKRYMLEIKSVRADGTFFLSGWSIGGLLAFNIAAEFAAQGEPPEALMMIDSLSPDVRRMISSQRPQGMAKRLDYLRKLLVRQIKSLQLSPGQQWERFKWMIQEGGRRLKLAIRKPPGYQARERLKHHYAIIADQYRSFVYPESATLFRSEQPAPYPESEHDLGWHKYIQGNLDVIRISGDHVSMVIEPQNMRMLAAEIMKVIDRTVAQQQQRQENSVDERKNLIDLFISRSKELTGKEVIEREPWNNLATEDAIRHFAYGICDDNPLWIDPEYVKDGPFPAVQAPPTFLISSRYPALHGATVKTPLIILASDIEFRWKQRIFAGERLSSSTRQGTVRQVTEPGGDKRAYIDGFATYWSAKKEIVGQSRVTIARLLNQKERRADDWSVYHYSQKELEHIQDGIHAEKRTGSQMMYAKMLTVGMELPPIVRGPLSIGDMVCWHAAIGPTYRPGPLGYKDTLSAPHYTVINPATGWPVKYSLQHEDRLLAGQRGMAAPFDNVFMRFSWISPLITNWMGDHGFLSRLHIKMHQPMLYGDTCWYSGQITNISEQGVSSKVTVHIKGLNQHGSVVASGTADVLLPTDSDMEPIWEDEFFQEVY